MSDLRRHIRDIPDFPKPGILFRDITPLLADADAFHAAIDGLIAPFRGRVDEALARNLPHGLQHPLIPDAARLELAHHHLVALPFEGHGVRSPCGHEPTSGRSASNDA